MLYVNMPQSAVLPGQQETPNAIRAMPVTRAIGIATPVSSSPSNNRPTSDGAMSNANPVAISTTAAKASDFLIALVARLVPGPGDLVGDGRELPAILIGVLDCPEVEGQLVDRTVELERTIIAVLDGRHTGARVLTDIEVLVFRELDWSRVFHRLPGHRLAVHE